MQTRKWSKDSLVGKVIFNWVTFFGIFNTPDNICTVIRNMLLGAPLMAIVVIFFACLALLALVGVVELPLFFLFSNDQLTYSMIMNMNGVCGDNISCQANQYILAHAPEVFGIWGQLPFVVGSFLLGTIAYIIAAIVGLGLLWNRYITKGKWSFKSKILNDLAEAHTDKICFKIDWKTERDKDEVDLDDPKWPRE